MKKWALDLKNQLIYLQRQITFLGNDKFNNESNRSKNKAVYTAALVACCWAGAVKSKRKHKQGRIHGPKSLLEGRNAKA